jgi:predicted DNA-binding transcriptional regulator AlpA
MDKLVIDTSRLWTKTAYSNKFGISRATLDKRIKEKEIPSVKVHGGILVVK